MSRIRRKRMHHSIRDNQRKFRTRARVKDLDQIHTDMKKGIQAIKHEVAVKGEEVDLPGLGQFYCLECSKYFISQDPLDKHRASKVHRRRLKELKDKPYTQEEADAAVGLKRADDCKSTVAEDRPAIMEM